MGTKVSQGITGLKHMQCRILQPFQRKKKRKKNVITPSKIVTTNQFIGSFFLYHFCYTTPNYIAIELVYHDNISIAKIKRGSYEYLQPSCKRRVC